MNIFQKFMDDVFSNEHFLEECFFENINYKCIVSPISEGIVFGDSGLENEEMFTLDIKLPMHKIPKKNDKVKFRGKMYKVSDTATTDSANTSVKFTIYALSKGIG